MTKQTFDIIAWCDRTYYAQVSVEAETPEQALEMARRDIHNPDGEECDDAWEWDRFRVEDPQGTTVLEHQDEHIRERLAARQMLRVLKAVRAAHSHIDTANSPAWLDDVETVIAVAEGRAA